MNMVEPLTVEAQPYWEERARRFANRGQGLAAVCSYGMPGFYNRAIDLCQRRALRPWLRLEPGSTALDVGCGVGRWSELLARVGARVTGVDLSPTMIAVAGRRCARFMAAGRCELQPADVVRLDLGRVFDLVLGVTVLQHIVSDRDLDTAVGRLAAHLARDGRLVLLEAAPSRRRPRCDSDTFRARPLAVYLELFARHGLEVHAITGVDPVPLKVLFLPYYRRLPTALAWPTLAAVIAISLPLDLFWGRRWVGPSWHKVMVLRHRGGDPP